MMEAVGACVEANADANLSGGGGGEDTAEGSEDMAEGDDDAGGGGEVCTPTGSLWDEAWCSTCAGTPKAYSCTQLLATLDGCVSGGNCAEVPPGPKAQWCCPE